MPATPSCYLRFRYPSAKRARPESQLTSARLLGVDGDESPQDHARKKLWMAEEDELRQPGSDGRSEKHLPSVETLSDFDGMAAELDAISSDRDQAASDHDQAQSDIDQRRADRDQAVADAEHATHHGPGEEYDKACANRRADTVMRVETSLRRAEGTAERLEAADARADGTAASADCGDASRVRPGVTHSLAAKTASS